MRRRKVLVGLASLAVWPGSSLNAAPSRSDRPPVIAIANFDYIDTSGESRDQRDQHRHRLFRFEQELKDGLARKSHQTVRLNCSAPVCSSGALNQAALIESAKNAGADLLVSGGIHKTSTLIEWIVVDVADVSANKLVLNRLLTFRGDTDAAWDHAARYVADLLNETISTATPQVR